MELKKVDLANDLIGKLEPPKGIRVKSGMWVEVLAVDFRKQTVTIELTTGDITNVPTDWITFHIRQAE